MSSQVKWNEFTSKNFNIKQGVRQGGVLSTHLYKSYINDLPLELEKRGLGLTIGLEYCGSPLCADDIVLMSTDDEEIQTTGLSPFLPFSPTGIREYNVFRAILICS
jgi:hypothetical protein